MPDELTNETLAALGANKPPTPERIAYLYNTQSVLLHPGEIVIDEAEIERLRGELAHATQERDELREVTSTPELAYVMARRQDLQNANMKLLVTLKERDAARAEAALRVQDAEALRALLGDAQLFLELTARGMGINTDGGRTISGTVLLAEIDAALSGETK